MQGIDWKLKLENASLTTAPASDAQALAKSATDKAITPGNLAAIGATATFAGLVELDTNAEALTGTDTARALTAANLAYVLSMIDVITFVGVAAAGPCVATGVKAGDIVVSVTGQIAADAGDKASLFESTVTVNDQIQQSSASNLTTHVYMALILRKS
jgi:hypothetical protein